MCLLTLRRFSTALQGLKTVGEHRGALVRLAGVNESVQELEGEVASLSEANRLLPRKEESLHVLKERMLMLRCRLSVI